MEENENKNEKFSKGAEELKNQTVDAAKKFKDTIKDTNIKEETKTTKNFLKDMFNNPLEKIQEVAKDKSGKYLKTALILIILWTLIVFIKSTYSTISLFGLTRIFNNFLSILKLILAPAISVLVYSIIILLMNNTNKKPLTDVIATVTVTKLPLILASLVSLLTIFSYKIKIITDPFASICNIISIIFGFFGFKFLFGEEKSKTFIKKYVTIQIIYYICYILISLLGIYI